MNDLVNALRRTNARLDELTNQCDEAIERADRQLDVTRRTIAELKLKLGNPNAQAQMANREPD